LLMRVKDRNARNDTAIAVPAPLAAKPAYVDMIGNSKP